MDEVFGKQGRLCAITARGWLSAWETAGLEGGDVLVGSSILAGEGVDVEYNGSFFAQGDITVLDDGKGSKFMGVRVKAFEPREKEPEPERGDEMVELLPFQVVVGEVELSLSELRGAGIGSIISLDSTHSMDIPMELRIAGFAAARGPAIVSGERMGMRIDEVAPSGQSVGEILSSGSVLKSAGEKEGIKLYDWLRPDACTYGVMHALDMIHRRAASALGTRFKELADYRVTNVDQLNWGELMASLSADYSVIMARMERPERPYERDRDPGSFIPRPLVQSSSANVIVSEDVLQSIGRWNEQRRKRTERKKIFVFTDGQRRFEIQDHAPFLSCLRSGWKLVSDCAFGSPHAISDHAALRVRGDDQDAPGLPDTDMIALVSLEGPGGRMHIVYALDALHPYLNALDRYGRRDVGA